VAVVNYRHAYHAGNFADCVKHALLVWLLRALTRKAAPLFVLDTHAGAGRYDLVSGSMCTREWQLGIASLLDDDPPSALEDYLGLVRALGLYPGSPEIARAMLRSRDRLVCCELHAEDAHTLRCHFAGDHQVAVHRRDGWEALGALLPPRERRGLVLIDPPFEDRREFERLANNLATGWRRFPTGVFTAWYPIKQRALPRQLLDEVRQSGMRDIVTAELYLREPTDPKRLNGCGILVVNPPYRFEHEVPALLSALLDRLGGCDSGKAATVRRIIGE
jgi:23S rRNA (adenine2030-N6)-methyltransferase